MKQIKINNLLWDTENLEIDGKKYFTWQEALDAAKSVGKRLPTKEELEGLVDAGWKWDEEKKGMRFSDGELFFPLSGNLQGTTNSYYWSSSPRDASYSWVLRFNSGNAGVIGSNPKNGFPVRCVQDISDNSEPMPKIHETFDAYLRGVFNKKEQDVDLDLYIKLSDLKNITLGDLVEMYNRLNGK